MSAYQVFQRLMEPHWQDVDAVRSSTLPAQFSDWLIDPGSLTSKIIAACGDSTFRVRLLSQRWGQAFYSESHLLNMRRREAAIIREVELQCDNAQWVFARTLIPASSFSGKARRLAYLREKPLGAVLFADPTTVRDRMQIARLQPGHPLFELATKHLHQKPAELWGRRTLFYYAQQPLLVNEIFLPDIVAV